MRGRFGGNASPSFEYAVSLKRLTAYFAGILLKYSTSKANFTYFCIVIFKLEG